MQLTHFEIQIIIYEEKVNKRKNTKEYVYLFLEVNESNKVDQTKVNKKVLIFNFKIFTVLLIFLQFFSIYILIN